MGCRSRQIVGPKLTDLIMLNESRLVSAGVDPEIAPAPTRIDQNDHVHRVGIAARVRLHIRDVEASGELGSGAACPSRKPRHWPERR